MKRLRNKKTGQITKDVCSFDTREFTIGIEYENSKGQIERTAYSSLTELNEEWEDYVEPHIKDEKIRKAVRAWAEANDVDLMRVAPFAVFDIESSASIYLRHRIIEDDSYDEFRHYSITELCGEGEE